MLTKILMVCLGNICRSPLAEGILQAKLSKEKFIVDSAGTLDFHVGEKPDIRSIAVAKKYGIEISSQKCRQIKSSDFDNFDYIYVMDKSNYKNVIALAPNQNVAKKVKLILEEINHNENLEVPDPYYGTDEDFDKVFKMLDKACTAIANKLNC